MMGVKFYPGYDHPNTTWKSLQPLPCPNCESEHNLSVYGVLADCKTVHWAKARQTFFDSWKLFKPIVVTWEKEAPWVDRQRMWRGLLPTTLVEAVNKDDRWKVVAQYRKVFNSYVMPICKLLNDTIPPVEVGDTSTHRVRKNPFSWKAFEEDTVRQLLAEQGQGELTTMNSAT